jgi:hypothetical protein
MRKSNKFIVVAGTLAALAVPSAAMAAAPNSTVTSNPNAAPQSGNLVAIQSSDVIQNGQWVSGNNDAAPQWWTDQTSSPGSRGVYVQGLLGHDSNGKPGAVVINPTQP